MFNLIGAGNTIFKKNGLGDYQYLEGIVDFLDMIVVPLTVILFISAAIMAIIIGVAIAKADSGDKAQEMKKRLIGLIITCFVVTALIWLLGAILSNYGTIMDFIRNVFTGKEEPVAPSIPESSGDSQEPTTTFKIFYKYLVSII